MIKLMVSGQQSECINLYFSLLFSHFSLIAATFLLDNTNYIKQNISCPMLNQLDLMSAMNVEHFRQTKDKTYFFNTHE